MTVKPKPTLASLDERVSILENMSADISKIKGLLKWCGPTIIAVLVANGKVGTEGANILNQIFGFIFGS